MIETEFLSPHEAAKFLGISPACLRLWREKRQGPAAYRVGGRWRYSEADLRAYLDACRIDPSADTVA